MKNKKGDFLSERKHENTVVSIFRKYRTICVFFLSLCLLMNGLYFDSMKVQAVPEQEVNATPVYAIIGEQSASDYSLTQTEGKEPFGFIIQNGTYTVASSSDLPLFLDNAQATYPNGQNIDVYSVNLSGKSKVVSDKFDITDDRTEFGSNVEESNIGDFINSYYVGDLEPYSFTFKSDTSWSYRYNMKDLTVNENATLTLDYGTAEDSSRFSSYIEAKNATINGNVVINDFNGDGSNKLVILDNGTLTINNQATLTGNGRLEIGSNVNVTGITLYDRYDGESGEWIKFTADGTQENTGEFEYRIDESSVGRWVLANNGPAGGDTIKYRFRNNTNNSNLVVMIGSSEIPFDVDQDFVTDQAINFTLNEKNAYVVSTADSSVPIAKNETTGVYTYTPITDNYFEILIYSNRDFYDFDQMQPDQDNFVVEIEVRTNGNDNQGNNVTYPDVPKASIDDNGTIRTKLKFANNIDNMQIGINVADGYEYEIIKRAEPNPFTIVEHQTANTSHSININFAEENRFEICFSESSGGEGEGGNQPGPEPGPGMDIYEFVEFIENSMFAFGDWELDGDVDVDDVKAGMADQIFYPNLNNNNDLKVELNVETSADLVSKINVEKNVNNDITAYDIDNNPHTIPAYDYTVTLKEADGNNLAIQVHGTAYAFSFNDTNENDKFIKNSLGLVLAVAEKNGNKQYFLRVANAYDSTYDSSDTQPIVYDENAGEQSIVIVADYDVDLNANRRNVEIFGNGASLQALFTQENDADIAAFQGSNEDFFRDIGKSYYTTFSTFAFVQTSFMGVDVRGSGTEGNTPSWSFNQYKVFSTSSNINADNEAVVFFGNDTVHIKPTSLTNISQPITSIASISVADSNVPTAAVEITAPENESKEWLLKFKSSFYDNVRVEIVYNLTSGRTSTSYITIHRVGVDILSGNSSPGSSGTLFHGTENGPSYTSTGDYVIWGTYYYPNASDPAVDLYVTYTWKDNTVTRETIKNKGELTMAAANGNAKSSDFILYDGSEANAPEKIEVIALVSGFENKQTFGGAKFGSGKGVVWNYYARN